MILRPLGRVSCKRGILITGTNERHPAVGVFSLLGIMAVKLLVDTSVALQPRQKPVIFAEDAAAIANRWPGGVAQF